MEPAKEREGLDQQQVGEVESTQGQQSERSFEVKGQGDQGVNRDEKSVLLTCSVHTTYRTQLECEGKAVVGSPPSQGVEDSSSSRPSFDTTHGTQDQAGVPERLAGSGRRTSSQVGAHRTEGPTARVGARVGSQQSEAPSHASAADDPGPQQGVHQEGESTAVLRGAGHEQCVQQHHHTAAERGHGSHLHAEQGGCQRPGGLRDALGHVIWGDCPEPSGVLPVGCSHGPGGAVQPSAEPPGQLARAEPRPDGQSHTQTGKQLQAGAEGESGPTSRQLPRVSWFERHSCASGSHDEDHDTDGEHAGRDGRAPRTGPQEVQGRGERDAGLLVSSERRTEVDGGQEPGFQVSSTEGQSLEQQHAPQEGKVGKVLTPAAMRHFHHISQDIAANAFEGLKGDSGVHLVEIACSPESRLSAQIQREAGREDAAVRCSFWNGCDLGTGEGVKLIMGIIQEKHPKHVHISPECGPYSPMQNLNQKTAAQKQELEQKRRAALKQYVGASCIFQFCIQMGIHVTWEWAEKCQAWRLPMIQRLMEKYSLYVATTHGCQVNLRNGDGQLMKKGWKLMTTHKRVADMMHMPCRCQKGFRHATCEGNDTRKTAYYTMEYVKRFVEAIRYEMSRQQWMEELNGESRLPKHFGNGHACVCSDLQHHETQLTCGSCSLETTVDLTGRTDTEDAVGRVYAGETETASDTERKRIQRQLYLLHAATGHSSTRNMIDALQKRGVSAQVMEEARRFKCQVCEEKQKLQPRQVASLEPLPPKWATACADGGNWTHPETQQTVGFAVIIDEGTRFRTARILSRGKKQTMNAAQFLSYFQEGWVQYFGQPQVLRLDPAGAFRSNEVETYCDKNSIYLDFVPAEAHWKFGICEQAVQGLKEVMNKLASEQPTISAEEALSTAVQVFNHRELVTGYSPVQHAMGIAPDATGRFIHSLDGRAHDLVVGNPTGEFEDTVEKMKVAEQAHSEWNARERIKRALNSRSRENRDFRPGDLVYYWRKQLPKSMGPTKMGGYLGPARVLVTETKREPDGQLRKGSAVWVIRGRRLLKCAPEQLRHATQREELLEHLSKDEEQQAPWTLPRMVQQLGGQEYEDISQETPNDKPSVVEEMELEPRNTPEVPPQVRHRWKRPVDTENPEQQLRSRPPPAARNHMDEDLQAEAWWSHVEFQEPEQEAQEKWENPDMAIEVAIDMPSTNRGWKDMTRDMYGYFVGAMKRRAAEVSEKRLDEESKEKFRAAKAVEVKNFIAAKAFELVPPEMRPPKEKAIGMRWILSWKLKEDGTQKAKARAILLGYQDPGYEHRGTTTPVMTRQSRQFLLQIAANRKWLTQKGDVSGAFLQGREYPGELFCIPCKEICEAMGVEEGTITKVKRGCYGLVDAPLEWYRSISQFLERLGLQKTWSDPCLWVWKPQGQLRGIISCHVDDFLFTGPRNDAEWEGILKAIQQEYSWGEWQEKKFVQCGVQIEEMPDNSYRLSQPQYM